jgi:hypothetical protein
MTSRILALLIYTALSIMFFGSSHDWSAHYIGQGSDALTYIWSLNWWPWAILHGINPMLSRFVWYPAGFHLAWADAVPGAALISLPIILLGNAVVAYNVMMVLAPAAAAWSNFLLVRYLTRDSLAALIAGYIFGFSTYEICHTLGHLSLTLIFPIPLIALVVCARSAERLSRPWFLAVLVALLLLLFGFSLETFATAYMFGTIAWLSALLWLPEQRKQLLKIGFDISVATIVVVSATIPWFVSMWYGRNDVPDIINLPQNFSTDLANFVIPTILTRLGGLHFRDISQRFAGNISEQSGYIGLPVIAIIILWARDSRHTSVGRFLLFVLALLVMLSIGPTVEADGSDLHTWTPWRLFLSLPLIRHALPGRFSMYVALVGSIAIGLWLAAARTSRSRAGRLSLCLVAIIFLVPDTRGFHPWAAIPSLPFFTKENVDRALGPTPNIVILPSVNQQTGDRGPSMIWQWQSGMAFTQSGGYVGNVPPEASTWAAVWSFDHGIVGHVFEDNLKMFASAHRVAAIVSAPGTQIELLDALDKLGWKTEEVGGVRIFHVPDLGHYPYFRVEGQYWATLEDFNWMGRRATITANGAGYLVRINTWSRPHSLPPAILRIAQENDILEKVICANTIATIPLPAGTGITLTTRSTFVPNQIQGNGDFRELSVLLKIEEDTADTNRTNRRIPIDSSCWGCPSRC